MLASDRQTPKLRSACENCRQSKVKCNLSGKNVCIRCLRHGLQCRYGFANRSGKPKGSKNRATLRRMGQLPGVDKKQAEFVTDKKCHGDANHERDGIGGLESSHGRLSSSSPHSLEAVTMTDTPSSTESSPLGSLLDPTASPGLGYPTSPTFASKDPFVKETSDFSLLHIPFTLAPTCDCAGMQAYQMNHLATDTAQPRFDESLQSIKTTLSTCRNFLQGSSCQKDSASLLLSVSALDLALQDFRRWIPYKPEQSIRYGQYELDEEESRRVGGLLGRGLLLQCRGLLGVMREMVDGICVGYSDVGGILQPVDPVVEYLQQMLQGQDAMVERYLRASIAL